MLSAIFFYLRSSLKNSFLYYILVILFFVLLYYQTLGINIEISNQSSFGNLWGVSGNNLVDYLGHIGIHYFILSLVIFLLLVNITSAFFSHDYIVQFLIKGDMRWKILLKYTLSLSFLIYLFFLVHILLLNFILYLISGSLFFIKTVTVLIYIVPLVIHISIIIIFSVIIFNNNFYKLFFTYLYLVIMPFVLIAFNRNSVDIPIIPNWVLEYSEYFAPFFLTYIGGVLKYSLYIDIYPNMIGILIMSPIIYCLSMGFFQRKVY